MSSLATNSGSPLDRVINGVSGPDLMSYVREIARWERLSGSADELESLRWVQGKLEEFGYRTRLLHHEGYISLPGEARLQVVGEPSPIECITHSFAASTPPEGLQDELVFVDLKQAASQRRAFEGKIVLVDGRATPVSALTLEQLGAKAQIYIHDDYLHESSVSPVWGNPTDKTIQLMPRTPSISIRRADGERLKELLRRGPVHVSVHATVETGWRPVPLLVADLGDTETRPFVLLSCHIDSWYYGAMDNGAANATVIEVARLMSGHRGDLCRGLRIAFWSGHSHGRYCGSAWYADTHYHELAERCVCHVNADSTGGRGAAIVTEPPVMPMTHDLAGEVLEEVTGEQLVGKRIGRFADQSFYGIGVPSLFATLSEQDAASAQDGISFKTGGQRAGGLGWWWHTPYDTVDKVDEANLVRDTRIYAAAVYRLLTDPLLPFNFVPAVREIRDTVKDLAARAGGCFDFNPLLAELERLESKVRAFHQRLQRLDGGDEAVIARANAAMMQLSRRLVPVAFHENGPFEHDPCEPLKPVPALQPVHALAQAEEQSDRFFLIRTRLRKRYNWVFSEITAAGRCLDQFLES